VAPGVFTVTDIAEVTGTGPDELLRQAARACPAGAILLLDADTGEEVDP
jgi:ferredoxin